VLSLAFQRLLIGTMAITGVVLDAHSLGQDIDLGPLQGVVDRFVCHGSTEPDQVAERLRGAEVVFTNKVLIDRRVMSSCPSLKLICVLATGTDNIDIDEAQKRNIKVTNAVAYGTESVAQHALMLILMLASQQARYGRAVAAGEWSRSAMFCLMAHPVIELAGRHLVIVGQGNLGRAVAGHARHMGMKVTFSARPGSESNDARPALAALLTEADFLSLHCPLTEQTRNLIDSGLLATANPGLNIVNCSRGGIVNERDVLSALREGRIRGYASDVLSAEPPPLDHPLIQALGEDLNLVLTPHNAWISTGARQAIVSQAAEAVRRHLR
jgi:glycerate dehydrogenase